ncbi:unnamed protein product [Prorocentrum cordatum]|uniref:Uncharacterized protein n=1 Tax=Prorocentrum cordatum TaxID=2364126 RepID=A0ABN9WS77_9DINO|nr:unnamed protein product [Polarella glacialis]
MHLLSARAVYGIREVYSDFEAKMYPNATLLVSKGNLRGIPGHRRDGNFDLLTSGEKKLVCEIPLSQPGFLMMVLIVWTLTCLSELRKLLEASYKIIWATKTVPSMSHSCKPMRSVPTAIAHEHQFRDVGNDVYVIGLTVRVKLLIFLVVLLPRGAVTLALLLLGCRWLTATPSLGELLLNVVALEFVLLLKDTIYGAMVTAHGKFETARTFLEPAQSRGDPSSFGADVLRTALWTVASVSWVVLYVYHWQGVLPSYRWDVQDLCRAFLDPLSEG